MSVSAITYIQFSALSFVLSFIVDCVEHNEIPLEAIAKFFYGQRVGIISWIDVVEYVEVSVCGAEKLENFRRLYVHF